MWQVGNFRYPFLPIILHHTLLVPLGLILVLYILRTNAALEICGQFNRHGVLG